MSGSNKRKLNDSFTEEDETEFHKGDDGLSGGARSSRARKKSAKVLEMEEFEVELSSSVSKGNRTRKKSGKSQESEVAETPAKSPKSPTRSKKKSPAVAAQPVEDLLAVYEDIKEEGLDNEQASALKMMLSLPVKSEANALQKDENTSAVETLPEIAPKGKSKGKSNSKKSKKSQKQRQQTVDVGFSSSDEVKQLELNVKDEDDFPEEPPLVVAEKVKKKRSAPKKKKLEQQQKALAIQPALLNFQPDAKVETMDYEAFVQTMEEEKEVKEEDIEQEVLPQRVEAMDHLEQDMEPDLEGEEGGEGLYHEGEEEEDPQLTITSPPAAVKANSKKKTTPLGRVNSKKRTAVGLKGKTLKGKARKKEDKEDKTPKRRTTAYTLWCNNTRKELMMQYPTLDFAQISKKLAELWQTVSVAEKNTLRKKARKIQKKQNNGQDVSTKELPASTHMRSGQPQVSRNVVVSPSQTDQSAYTALPVAYNFKVTGNAPIDVAAHLKLLGESLGTIGARLQEHRGHIAVQGSLSVLLDSLICALGPLMCLTNQVPELDSVPIEIHHQTLDNIAYIMPGIG